jgi:hypothetical protein
MLKEDLIYMLPTYPQPIMQVFLNGVKACKKNFKLLFPITLVSLVKTVTMDLYWSSVAEGGEGVIGLVVFFLDAICFYWGICFAYKLLTENRTSYVESFKVALKRFFRTIVSRVILVFLITLIVAFFVVIIYTLSGFDTGHRIFWISSAVAGAFLVLLLLYLIVFDIIYSLEILVQNSKILPTMKRVTKVTFRVENLQKVFCLGMLFVFVCIIISIPYFIIGYFYRFHGAPLAVMMDMSILILFPLRLMVSVYFYHDLMLRFKSKL